ncbi:MAG: GNAT family N-acetyltransferase [Chitinophagales bacterium]
MEIIESKRLLLRPFIPGDSNFILELLNTEGWLKYIGDRNVKTIQQANYYLENGPIKSYKVNGFGLSMVQLKENNKPIGMSGLIRRDYLDHPDIGFAFLPGYTGKGYAYEIAKEIIYYGFNRLQLQQILAITLPENSSSIRLLEKLGLRYQKKVISKDTNEELSLYSINPVIFPEPGFK